MHIHVYEIINLSLFNENFVKYIKFILAIHHIYSHIRIMNIEAYKIYRYQEDVDELILT